MSEFTMTCPNLFIFTEVIYITFGRAQKLENMSRDPLLHWLFGIS